MSAFVEGPYISVFAGGASSELKIIRNLNGDSPKVIHSPVKNEGIASIHCSSDGRLVVTGGWDAK